MTGFVSDTVAENTFYWWCKNLFKKNGNNVLGFEFFVLGVPIADDKLHFLLDSMRDVVELRVLTGLGYCLVFFRFRQFWFKKE